MFRALVVGWAILTFGTAQIVSAADNYEYRSSPQARMQVAPLLEALKLDGMLDVMRAEGLDYALELRGNMFPTRGEGRWTVLVEEIYAPDRMRAIMLDEMSMRLKAPHLVLPMAFFKSEVGQRIVGLELSARDALRDPSILAASRVALDDLRQAGGTRLELLERFAEVNDLIEMNVAGSLNSNFAFFDGLNRAGGYGAMRSEADILRDIWIEEPAIREEAETWVLSFLALAYGPLADEYIVAYTDFCRTPAGQALNGALFASFDVLFEVISRELGMAAAQFVGGEDL